MKDVSVGMPSEFSFIVLNKEGGSVRTRKENNVLSLDFFLFSFNLSYGKKSHLDIRYYTQKGNIMLDSFQLEEISYG